MTYRFSTAVVVNGTQDVQLGESSAAASRVNGYSNYVEGLPLNKPFEYRIQQGAAYEIGMGLLTAPNPAAPGVVRTLRRLHVQASTNGGALVPFSAATRSFVSAALGARYALTRDSSTFGLGTDGDLTVTGNLTLSRAMYFDNLTFTATGTITTSGWPVFVRGVLTLPTSRTSPTVPCFASIPFAQGGSPTQGGQYGLFACDFPAGNGQPGTIEGAPVGYAQRIALSGQGISAEVSTELCSRGGGSYTSTGSGTYSPGPVEGTYALGVWRSATSTRGFIPGWGGASGGGGGAEESNFSVGSQSGAGGQGAAGVLVIAKHIAAPPVGEGANYYVITSIGNAGGAPSPLADTWTGGGYGSGGNGGCVLLVCDTLVGRVTNALRSAGGNGTATVWYPDSGSYGGSSLPLHIVKLGRRDVVRTVQTGGNATGAAGHAVTLTLE